MPLPTQHSLLCILLIWTTVISIVQAVFFILFLTGGHNGWPQNNSITEPAQLKHFKESTTPLPPGMLSYKAKTDTSGTQSSTGSSDIYWEAYKTDTDLMSKEGTALTLKKGGYYFLNLQVTLESCEETQEGRTVSLKLAEKEILRGRFDPRTNSSGLISKVVQVSTGEKLLVTIDLPSRCVSQDDAITHLSIIYMPMS